MNLTPSQITPSFARHARGFSLTEILLSIGIAGTMVGVAVPIVYKAQEGAKETKLREDVATLNSAVRSYLASGGRIEADADATTILPKLKTVAAAVGAKRLVGMTRSFIDPRLSGRLASKEGRSRAIWNQSTQRFDVTGAGRGFESFALDDAAATLPAVEETRQTAQVYAKNDGWVWDHSGSESAAAPEVPGALAMAAEPTPVFSPQASAPTPLLQKPQISLAPGLYPYTDYPLNLTLTNTNPPGTSRLFYSINGGGWQAYATGSTISVPNDRLDTTVATYAAPIDGERYSDSTSASSLYQTIFFKGKSSGVFSGPAGDSGLVTNLSGNKTGTLFTWGNPVDTKKGSNWLQFSPGGSFWVLPEQEFKIGEIKYYNGTTYSGTNATSVKMDVALNLEVPSVTENLNFSLKLQSTPNNGKSADADADYVWIPTLSSKFKTTVQGQTFYLQLRFGQSSSNGFTTIDEFHVHEEKTATGAVYGKLTTTPQF